MRRFSVAVSGSLPSRYASMMSSSCSTAISISSLRALAAAAAMSSGIVLVFELRAQRLFEPDDRAVLDEIDEALEPALDADRKLEHRRTRAQAVA